MKFKVLIVLVLFAFILQFASASFNVSLSDQGTDIKYKLNGSVVRTGNLEVTVYDDLTAGNLIYNETFTGKIHNGSWNVMLGENYSNPLSLEFGKIYYRDYKINNEDVDFVNITGETLERQFFYSPLGNIGGEDILPSANLSIANLTVSGNVSSAGTGLFNSLAVTLNVTASWFNGLFNFVTGLIGEGSSNNYLIFNGSTLSFNETYLNNTLLSEGTRLGFNDTYNASYALYNDTALVLGVNTTANIQNLLNSTGIYNKIANSTGGWTLNLSVLYVNGTEVTGSGGSGVPTGAIMAFNSASCPVGWVLADGTSGTPDLRGIFIRGSGTSGVLSMANGTAFNANYGTYGNDMFQGHFHKYYYNHFDNPNTAGYQADALDQSTTPTSVSNRVKEAITDGTNGAPRTGAETTPAYYATIYCVKTGEDTPVSNSIWGESGNNVILQNTSKNLVINNTNFFINTTSGNVGIGTANPTERLQVGRKTTIFDGTSTTASDWSDFGYNVYYSGGYKSILGGEASLIEMSSAGIGLYTSSTNAVADGAVTWNTVSLFIENGTGNLGIGTTAPEVALDTNGRFRVLNTSSASPTSGTGLNMYYSVAGDYGSIYAYNHDTGTAKHLILQAAGGAVGIGTAVPRANVEILTSTNSYGGTLITNNYFTIASGVAETIYTFDTRSSGVVYVNAVDASAGAGSTYQAVVYWSYSNDNLATSIVENVGGADAGLSIAGNDLQITSAVAAFTEVAITVIGNRR